MAKQRSLFRKIILLVIAFLILIPCSVLLYDITTAAGEQRVDFYYMMNDGSMRPVEKRLHQSEREDTLMTVLQMLKEGAGADSMQKTIPDAVSFLSVKLEGDTAVVDFSAEYAQLDALEAAICRSSVVWTLTSLDFVENICFTMEGETLLDANGEAYDSCNRDTVWIDSEISAETTGYAILTLYFANADGTELVTEERVVEANANQTREKTILEQLIAGPAEKGNVGTIPVGTKLRDVTTTDDGICYVNLSEDFVLKHTGGEKEELLTIYSIVNSLCRLDYVDRVQFLIEGKKLDTFKDNLQFKTPFTAVESIKALEKGKEN